MVSWDAYMFKASNICFLQPVLIILGLSSEVKDVFRWSRVYSDNNYCLCDA